jgi:hypothetical protein
VPGKPANGGIFACLNAVTMHVPVDVPANGAPIVTLETLPLDSKVTAALV